jgi:hypothetical protein
MKRPWPTRAVLPWGKIFFYFGLSLTHSLNQAILSQSLYGTKSFFHSCHSPGQEIRRLFEKKKTHHFNKVSFVPEIFWELIFM